MQRGFVASWGLALAVIGCGGQTGVSKVNSDSVDSGIFPLDASGALASGFLPEPPVHRCQSDADCQDGEACVEDKPSLFVCRRRCTNGANGAGTCTLGEVCYGYENYRCLHLCRPFRSPSDCALGDWCQPQEEGRTGLPPDVGLCKAGNDVKEGEACVNGCGPDLACVGSGLAVPQSFCAPTCDPAGRFANSGCTAGRCIFWHPLCTTGTCPGACVVDCDPFGENSCPDGHACFPFDEVTANPFTRIVHGMCIKPGTLPEGTGCDPKASGVDECAAGLGCIQEPPPSIGQYACRRFCKPDAASACKSDEACVPFHAGGLVDIGACFPKCTLWQAGSSPSGCPTGKWCAPRFAQKDSGICSASGTVPTDGPCGTDSDCAAGNACRCRGSYDAVTDHRDCSSDSPGRCTHVCDPNANTGGPGACPNGGVCFAVTFQSPAPLNPSAVGFCFQACNREANTHCASKDQICVPGEITGTADYCVDTPIAGDCTLELCGPLARCSDGHTGECTGLCLTGLGAAGSVPFPDCPFSTCTAIPSSTTYGRCGAP